MNENSTMKDFVHALAALLDEYDVEIFINDKVDICFESKVNDFEISTTGYADRTFNNVVVALDIGNYEVK